MIRRLICRLSGHVWVFIPGRYRRCTRCGVEQSWFGPAKEQAK